MIVTHRDVVAAAERIAGRVVRTPAAHSRTLSEVTGADVIVKFENLQFTASYKERGALNRLLEIAPGAAGVVAASAGNFAQGVAHHGGVLGIPVTIVMPRSTPAIKVSRTAALGAEVVRHGDSFDDARAHAAELATTRGLELLSPFDDPAVIAGQGTVALELLTDFPDLEAMVVPVGGGGLLAGMAVATRRVAPAVELVGVQSERFPAVHNAVSGDHLRSRGPTIAEGIAVAHPGINTLQLIAELVDRVEVVAEGIIEQAIALMLEIEKTVAEGAGAVALAELLARPDRYAGRRVGLILSGGNIDLRQLASVILRALVTSGRLDTFWVELDDQPGTLGAVTSAVGEAGGNIVEVVHRRLDPSVHARSTEVELTIETVDRAHAAAIRATLTERGYRVRTADPAG